MANSYPPDEISDVEGPANRRVFAPNANAGRDQVRCSKHAKKQERAADEESPFPPSRHACLDGPADLVSDASQRLHALQHAGALEDFLRGDGQIRYRGRQYGAHDRASSADSAGFK